MKKRPNKQSTKPTKASKKTDNVKPLINISYPFPMQIDVPPQPQLIFLDQGFAKSRAKKLKELASKDPKKYSITFLSHGQFIKYKYPRGTFAPVATFVRAFQLENKVFYYLDCGLLEGVMAVKMLSSLQFELAEMNSRWYEIANKKKTSIICESTEGNIFDQGVEWIRETELRQGLKIELLDHIMEIGLLKYCVSTNTILLDSKSEMVKVNVGFLDGNGVVITVLGLIENTADQNTLILTNNPSKWDKLTDEKFESLVTIVDSVEDIESDDLHSFDRIIEDGLSCETFDVQFKWIIGEIEREIVLTTISKILQRNTKSSIPLYLFARIIDFSKSFKVPIETNILLEPNDIERQIYSSKASVEEIQVFLCRNQNKTFDSFEIRRKLDPDNKHLESLAREIRSGDEVSCPICLDGFDFVFPFAIGTCNHVLCLECSQLVNQCPICRQRTKWIHVIEGKCQKIENSKLTILKSLSPDLVIVYGEKLRNELRYEYATAKCFPQEFAGESICIYCPPQTEQEKYNESECKE